MFLLNNLLYQGYDVNNNRPYLAYISCILFAGTPKANMDRMIAPVDVPTIKSKTCHNGLRALCYNYFRRLVVITPLMPPPYSTSIFFLPTLMVFTKLVFIAYLQLKSYVLIMLHVFFSKFYIFIIMVVKLFSTILYQGILNSA